MWQHEFIVRPQIHIRGVLDNLIASLRRIHRRKPLDTQRSGRPAAVVPHLTRMERLAAARVVTEAETTREEVPPLSSHRAGERWSSNRGGSVGPGLVPGG